MTNANETTIAGLSGYGSLMVGSNYIQIISNRNNSSLWVMLEAELIFKSFDSNLGYDYYPIDYICGTYKKFDASVIKYSLPIKSSWFVNPADDETYFLDNDGKVITGWQVVDGDLKYFNETNNYIPNLYEDGATSKKSGERPCGALCKNEMTPSGLFVDEEGEPKSNDIKSLLSDNKLILSADDYYLFGLMFHQQYWDHDVAKKLYQKAADLGH